MSTFRIGQRVRAIFDAPRGKRGEPRASHPAIFRGCEATVVGTSSAPNPGFSPELGNYSIHVDGYDRPVMAYGWQIVPLYDGGLPAESESINLTEESHV